MRKFLKVAWFLPGFLLWASFPPMGERTDVIFALAPLIWLSRRADAKTSARRWFMSGAFFWVATLSWMPAIVKNGGPWPLVALGWLALAAYCAGYFALYGWLSAKYWSWARWGEDAGLLARSHGGEYWKRLLGVLVVEPVLWCGLELVRARFLGGFAWNQLGVVLTNGGFGAPAALGGVPLCSAVVILVNGTFAGIAERVWRPEASGFAKLRRLGTLETLLAFGVVAGIYAASRTGGADAAGGTEGRPLKVALVQRNFPCVFQRREQNPYEQYGKLLENFAMLKPDLVVLAESAMCEFGPADQQGAVRFAEWASERCGGAAVLAGGTRYGDGKEYNSAALYGFRAPQDFQVLSIYDKAHLVPFGEFIPGDKWITALQKLAPVGSCTPGELKLLELPLPSTPPPAPSTNHQAPCTKHQTLPLGIAICFEDTDSAQVRKLAKMGARVLVFITNDSWFSHSIEPVQHAWQATARAIETGLPVVRVGNSGVTGTVTPDGKVTWLIGDDGRPLVDRGGTMFDLVPGAWCLVPDAGGDDTVGTPHQAPSTQHHAPCTLYVTLGDWPLAIAFALLMSGMFLVKYKAHHEKRRRLSL